MILDRSSRPPSCRGRPAGSGSRPGRQLSCTVDEDFAVRRRRAVRVVRQHLHVLKTCDPNHRLQLVPEIEPLEEGVFLSFENLTFPQQDRTNQPGRESKYRAEPNRDGRSWKGVLPLSARRREMLQGELRREEGLGAAAYPEGNLAGGVPESHVVHEQARLLRSARVGPSPTTNRYQGGDEEDGQCARIAQVLGIE